MLMRHNGSLSKFHTILDLPAAARLCVASENCCNASDGIHTTNTVRITLHPTAVCLLKWIPVYAMNILPIISCVLVILLHMALFTLQLLLAAAHLPDVNLIRVLYYCTATLQSIDIDMIDLVLKDTAYFCRQMIDIPPFCVEYRQNSASSTTTIHTNGDTDFVAVTWCNSWLLQKLAWYSREQYPFSDFIVICMLQANTCAFYATRRRFRNSFPLPATIVVCTLQLWNW